MHTLQLRLKTTAYDRQEIPRRFYALSHIHNVLVKHAKKLLCQLEHNKEYQGMLTEYRAFTTISGKTNTNGAKFDKATLTVNWLGLSKK